MPALCALCPGVAVPMYLWWHWGVGGMSMVMVGSVETCFLFIFSAFWLHSHLVLSVGELLVLIQWIMSVVHGVTSMSGPTSVHSYATKDDHILDIMPNVVSWLLWHNRFHP